PGRCRRRDAVSRAHRQPLRGSRTAAPGRDRSRSARRDRRAAGRPSDRAAAHRRVRLLHHLITGPTEGVEMTSTRFATILAAILAGAVARSSAIQSPPHAVTFSEDIAPIVYSNCVSCHRPGEAAPFSLISYDDVAKRAKVIAKVTGSRQMPPWHAAHGYGEFADERGLTDAQIATIREWVAAGTPQGNAAKMPPLPKFTDGWQLGAPDLVLEMPEPFAVPASGPDIYRNFVLPAGLLEDKWVRAVEFRPGTRKVVYHSVIHYIRGGSAAKIVSADG